MSSPGPVPAVPGDPAVPAVPPSAEGLGDLARRVADAYPDLFAHQRAGVAFLLSRRRAILADDMGLGKTRQAVIAVREAAPDGPYLVVCPSAVKLNWGREIDVVEPGADVHVVATGAGFEPGHRWTVVTYDLLARCEEAAADVPWAGVIVDEAHYIKNRSQRSARVLRLIGASGRRGAEPAAGGPFVYLLTGTPMANRPRDLFPLLQAVRHPVARSFYGFAKRYCAATDNGFGLDTRGTSNLDELARLVAGVMLRRTKDEALDLPEKMRTWLPVEVRGERVLALEERALDYLREHPARSGPTWTTFLGLLNRARHALAVAKAPATVEIVTDLVDAGHKVVVFTGATPVVERFLGDFGERAVAITGSHSAAQRQAAVDALQGDPAVRLLVGNLTAAGVGINLTAATHVVFNDLDWVPANHWQAEDRVHRIGQTAPTFATYCFAAGTLDAYVAALLEIKAMTIGVLEDAAAESASLVEAVVEAAVSGAAPVPGVRTDRARPPVPSLGVLEATLDLWSEARRTSALAEPSAGDRVTVVTSSSRPGATYEVRISGGVVTCTCPGFTYRGNCKHARVAAGA